MRKWTPDSISHAEKILSKSASVAEACKSLGCTASALRSAFRAAGHLSPAQYLLAPTNDLSELADKAGLSGRKAYIRRLEGIAGDYLYLSERVGKLIGESLSKYPIPQPSKRPPTAKNFPGKRTLTLVLSDIHGGLDISPREVFNNGYNWTVLARRLAFVAQQVAAWKPHRRAATSLRIVFGGDLIEGVIHTDDRGIRPLAEQIEGMVRVLVPFLDYVRKQFDRVDTVWVPGNHERMTYERTVAQRWNHHGNAIIVAVKQAFRHCPEITFDVPPSGIASWDLPCGGIGVATHGDTAPSLGNVGKALSIAKIESDAHRLSSAFKKPIRFVVRGHHHQAAYIRLPNKIVCLVNGCLCGANGFAQNAVGIFDGGCPEQIIWESTAQHPVGDFRAIQVSEADNLSELDELIPTPEFAWSE